MTDWIDDIEWTTFDEDTIVDVLYDKKGKIGEAEIRRILDKVSVAGNNSNTTVLYSGLENTKVFANDMKKAGYRIIDDRAKRV